MAMRETIGSLRAYFSIEGILVTGWNLRSLLRPMGTVTTLLSLAGLGFGVAYLWLGIRLRQVLARTPQQVGSVLIAGTAFLIVLLVLDLLSGMQGGFVTTSLVGLLINWYLWRNVRRLAAEVRGPLAPAT